MNDWAMNAIRALEVESGPSPLEAARTKRGLDREEAATRAGLGVDEITWLEEGRLYRFRSSHQAVAAAATYAAALGVDHREALELAGRPVPPLTASARRYRIIVGAGLAALVVLLVGAIAIGSQVTGGSDNNTFAGVPVAKLPPTERVKVDVYNGAGDRNYTGHVADRIVALAYSVLGVHRVKGPFNYRDTAVYYPPRAEAIGERLAKSLCIPARPLPHGKDRLRLVVIVGPANVGGC
jgi:hypothetical protein